MTTDDPTVPGIAHRADDEGHRGRWWVPDLRWATAHVDLSQFHAHDRPAHDRRAHHPQQPPPARRADPPQSPPPDRSRPDGR